MARAKKDIYADGDTLTTLVLTHRERVMLAHALTVSAAMVDALGDDARDLLVLWERVSEGVPS